MLLDRAGLLRERGWSGCAGRCGAAVCSRALESQSTQTIFYAGQNGCSGNSMLLSKPQRHIDRRNPTAPFAQ